MKNMIRFAAIVAATAGLFACNKVEEPKVVNDQLPESQICNRRFKFIINRGRGISRNPPSPLLDFLIRILSATSPSTYRSDSPLRFSPE